ncbi:Rrf2 family transcriptional regulator [Streptomyces coelicoflavus]|uniref:Rrf2 family transcriptional regulator n=1 Tax=Streptomyces coelicoflavus TaxID=285562 RepID=UPI0031F67CDD
MYLAGITDGRAVNSEERSRNANVNLVSVRRVLEPLRKAGLVVSRPGVNGGSAGVDAALITLQQVCPLLQEDQPVLGLHGPDPACATGRTVQRAHHTGPHGCRRSGHRPRPLHRARRTGGDGRGDAGTARCRRGRTRCGRLDRPHRGWSTHEAHATDTWPWPR